MKLGQEEKHLHENEINASNEKKKLKAFAKKFCYVCNCIWEGCGYFKNTCFLTMAERKTPMGQSARVVGKARP